ncbi:MAG: YbgA family protein, partial [Fervidobacterium sp.]
CGVNDAKLYSPNGRVLSKTAGIFAKEMTDKFPDIMIESEMRLTNEKIKYEFLTFVFTLAKFRSIKTKRELIDFHSSNKFLLLAKNEMIMRELGKVVAQKDFEDNALKSYRTLLIKALKTPVKTNKIINTLLHLYGFFKKKLSEKEKAYFMDLLEGYKSGIVALQSVIVLLKSWAIRYEVEYIMSQTFLEPFPSELIL